MVIECVCSGVFFFKQKTAYEMRISDWSSDVCSSDLRQHLAQERGQRLGVVVDAPVLPQRLEPRRDLGVLLDGVVEHDQAAALLGVRVRVLLADRKSVV